MPIKHVRGLLFVITFLLGSGTMNILTAAETATDYKSVHTYPLTLYYADGTSKVLNSFKEIYNINDPLILCRDKTCPSITPETVINVNFNTKIYTSDTMRVRIFLPPGTMFTSITLYFPRDSAVVIYSRIGQPPQTDYPEYPSSLIQNVVDKDPENYEELVNAEGFGFNAGGYGPAFMDTLSPPLEEGRWLFIRIKNYSPSVPFAYYFVKAAISINAERLKQWYDSVDPSVWPVVDKPLWEAADLNQMLNDNSWTSSTTIGDGNFDDYFSDGSDTETETGDTTGGDTGTNDPVTDDSGTGSSGSNGSVVGGLPDNYTGGTDPYSGGNTGNTGGDTYTPPNTDTRNEYAREGNCSGGGVVGGIDCGEVDSGSDTNVPNPFAFTLPGRLGQGQMETNIHMVKGDPTNKTVTARLNLSHVANFEEGQTLLCYAGMQYGGQFHLAVQDHLGRTVFVPLEEGDQIKAYGTHTFAKNTPWLTTAFNNVTLNASYRCARAAKAISPEDVVFYYAVAPEENLDAARGAAFKIVP